MNREQAYALMLEHTPSASLQRHMLNVEAAMRAYARHWGEDEELYAVAGLLHDFDYELHPQEHPSWGVNYLREHTDTPAEVLDAIMGHAAYTGTPRTTKLSQSLFAAGVNRDEVIQATQELGVELDEHMQRVLHAMQQFATTSTEAESDA